MPNANYIKGRRKEYEIMNDAKAKGLIAVRTAGSHGPFDVIIIHPYAKIIEFIQCKPDDMSENKKKHIEDENRELNGDYKAYFFVK